MSRPTQHFRQFMREREEAAAAYVNGNAAPLERMVATSGSASFMYGSREPNRPDIQLIPLRVKLVSAISVVARSGGRAGP
jgi:hypothetical protein